jgi:hypothetical protein
MDEQFKAFALKFRLLLRHKPLVVLDGATRSYIYPDLDVAM